LILCVLFPSFNFDFILDLRLVSVDGWFCGFIFPPARS
jgi:hypothetical protein